MSLIKNWAYRLFYILVSAFAVSCALQESPVREADHERFASASTLEGSLQSSISPAEYFEHVKFLASDQLEGRGTGSRGIDLAAGYIAGQFAAIGLRPGGDQGGYFQNFTVPSDPKIGSATRLT